MAILVRWWTAYDSEQPQFRRTVSDDAFGHLPRVGDHVTHAFDGVDITMEGYVRSVALSNRPSAPVVVDIAQTSREEVGEAVDGLALAPLPRAVVRLFPVGHDFNMQRLSDCMTEVAVPLAIWGGVLPAAGDVIDFKERFTIDGRPEKRHYSALVHARLLGQPSDQYGLTPVVLATLFK